MKVYTWTGIACDKGNEIIVTIATSLEEARENILLQAGYMDASLETLQKALTNPPDSIDSVENWTEAYCGSG